MTISSISCNRILANHTNQVRDAVIAVSAQRPSEDVRLVSQARAGGGRMTLAGPYTGAADTDVDVEIVSGAGALRASAPTINGVGNGSLAITALGVGAVPELYTFTLLDAGTPDVAAELDFFGVVLAARAPGAAGNALALSVTRNLTDTPLPFATLDAITAGTDTFDGPEFDWGQPPATGAGIPAGALRIRFERFPTVHRAWKVWEGGRFVYRLDPAPPFDIPADTRVLEVSGDYTLDLTDGVATEVYTGVVTVYDFAAQIEARSALVAVRGAIARDTAPGGMAVTDIPLRTDAHALPAKSTVRAAAFRGLDNIVVDPGAPTENLTLSFVGRTATGGGAWSVSGGVSGALPNASTGVPYAHGPVSFTIPALAAPPGTTARISAVVTLASRTDEEGLPAICFKPLRLGVAATDKSVTFTYRRRPPADCVCENMPALRVSDACLGLADGGSEMALDAEYQTRLASLYQWRAQHFSSNVAFESRGADGLLRADTVDIEIANGATAALAEALSEIYSSASALAQWDAYWSAIQATLDPYEGSAFSGESTIGLTSVVWTAEITVSAGQIIRPTVPNGRLYLVTLGGQLGATEPTWGSESSPITDGSAQLEALPPYWAASSSITSGALLQPGNGQVYKASGSGLTGASEPYWPVGAESVSDNEVVWERQTGGGGGAVVLPADIEVIRTAWFASGSSVAVLAYLLVGGEIVKTVEGFGVSEERAQADLDTQIELWRVRLSARLIKSADVFVDSVVARMDHVRTLAGIVPKSDASGAGGSSCWRDDPAATHWWVDESGEYLPAFTNKPYVSVTRDESGKIVSTQEFGFGIVTPCEHRLKEGDRFTITIRGAAASYAYAEGDTITIPVIAAAAAPFTGGADGDPTQTWTVRGSVSGALADWPFDPDAPAPYSAGEITAELAPGGIPFQVGDAIRIAIEGGRLRWRRDGGAWTEGDLYDVVHDLGDGLTLTALAGAAPSFVEGDAWTYRAVAKYGASRMRQPRIGHAFAFDTDGVVIDVDLGAIAPIESVLLALHTLPDSATLTIDGGDAAPSDWSVTPAVCHGAILAVPANGATARYLRVTIAGTVTGGTIGWLWAGVGWQPTVGASDLVLSRAYGLTRGAGINPAGLYRGRGQGGRWSWRVDDGGALFDAELDALMTLLDHVAAQGLEPVALVPDIRVPSRTSVAILDADSVELADNMNWQTSQRAVSLDLPFRAVLQ